MQSPAQNATDGRSRVGRAVAVVVVVAVVAALVLAGWLALQRLVVPGSVNTATRVDATAQPVVMRTAGGRLEIATVTAQERFSRADTWQFWGIPLGTTISQIEAPVVYRYHVEMAREWPMTIVGKTCIVRAGPVKPTLPVAFDTAATRKYTASGWARFNKSQNLRELERSMSAELGVRAGSESYIDLARDTGRHTVSEFVTTWLLKEHRWQRDPEHKVVVLFPGEVLPRVPADRAAAVPAE